MSPGQVLTEASAHRGKCTPWQMLTVANALEVSDVRRPC